MHIGPGEFVWYTFFLSFSSFFNKIKDGRWSLLIIVIQLKLYLLGMLTGPEKFVCGIVLLFVFFQQSPNWPTNHVLLSGASSLHRFVPRNHLNLALCWLDFGVILTSHVVRCWTKKWVTIIYLSINMINWCILATKSMWGGVDASFAPQANLVIIYAYSKGVKNICRTFVQCRPNAVDAGPTLYKWCTNALCLLGSNLYRFPVIWLMWGMLFPVSPVYSLVTSPSVTFLHGTV